jgi:hypothetical protein
LKKKFYFFTLAIILMAFTTFTGCRDPNVAKIFKAVDTLYVTIRAVVTTPEVRVQIPQDQFDRLARMENEYLLAKKLYIDTADIKEGRSAIEILLNFSGDFLQIFDSIPAMEKYQKEIKLARITVTVLTAQLAPG